MGAMGGECARRFARRRRERSEGRSGRAGKDDIVRVPGARMRVAPRTRRVVLSMARVYQRDARFIQENIGR